MRIAALSLLLGPLAAISPAQLYPGQLTPLTLAETFGGKSDFAVADLDEDGVSDVLARLSPTTLRVLLGDGLGGVGPESLVTLPQSPMRLVTDVTGDGHIDLVLHQPLQSQLFVAAGDGRGGFAPAVSYSAGSAAVEAFAAGDVDEDGDTDLVTATPNQLLVLPGDGLGGFLAAISVPVASFGGTKALQLAHLDADAHLDLAVSTGALPTGGPIRILLGDGDGGFVSGASVPIGGFRALQIVAADMDGDTDIDLVARADTSLSAPISTVAVVLLGDGAGGFTSTTVAAVDGQLTDLLLADDDHDGDLDVFVNDPSIVSTNGYLRVPNQGGGVFGAPAFALPDGRAFVGRFDGDGYDDVALFPDSSPGLLIAPGLADGGFRLPARVYFDTHVSGALVADMNGDGRLDLVHGTHSGAPRLAVWLGDGRGGFDAPLLSPAGNAVGELALGDLNEDGALDAVAAPINSAQLCINLGDGNGGFGPPVFAPSSTDAKGLVVADMDGDGHRDAVTVLGSGSTASLAVLRGDGSGALAAPVLTPSVALRTSIAAGDVDHDGVLDVVVNTKTGVRLLLGDGAGGIASVSDHVVDSTLNSVEDVVVADVNFDGHADVLTAHSVGVIGVLLGDGAGGLAPAQILSAGNPSAAVSISVLDVSGDGKPDVVLPRSDFARNFVLLGDGAGGFALESAGYLIGQGPGPLALGDLDGDHRPDVVTTLTKSFGYALHSGPAFTWSDLGQGLAAGSTGAPRLAATGTLVAGQPVKLVLSGARALAPAWLVVGFSTLELPFKGGTLVPNPALVLLVQTDAQGTRILQGPMPPGTPPGSTRYFQYWVADPAAPAGASASNAMAAVTP